MKENSYIGYFKIPSNIGDISTMPALQRMKELNCTMIFFDNIGERTELIKFQKVLQEGSVAVLYSYPNAFRSYDELIMFIRYCFYKKIRIISIEDEIDTEDLLWSSSTEKILRVISNFSTKRDSGQFNDYDIDMLTDTVTLKRIRRAAACINMYNAHFTVNEIKDILGYKNRKSIYDILNRHSFICRTDRLSRDEDIVIRRSSKSGDKSQ